jgi:hypothetical protein
MKTIAMLTAAAALTLGLAGTASAAPSGLDLAPQVGTESNVAPAGYYWQYRQFWYGNCFYRYIYVSNGYAYRYRYRYTCY